MSYLLEVENLSTSFGSGQQEISAVRGASFNIKKAKPWHWLANRAPENP